jgi:preprotein translocase subunit YajC
VKNALPLLALFLLLGGMLVLGRRTRARNARQESTRRATIGVGSEVMTTSGLYGTVVAVHDDDTVALRISSGVEVRWAFAALRDAASLPGLYRQPPPDQPAETGPDAPPSPGPPTPT